MSPISCSDQDESSSTTTTTTTTKTTDGLLHNKPIDLEKLFTPASDSGEATPSRNRKMYASSSFYSPNHPTVEDQVDLARRISHSLCDISNQQSKGQSMYVNRMKRSVKWVHEGPGKQGGLDGGEIPETPADDKLSFKIPNIGPQEMKFRDSNKPALKLVMDPRGQIQDIGSLRRQGYSIEPGALSPEVAFDLVRDLNAPRGKGAELFAKRRKRSEKWVVDENTVKMSATSSSQVLTSSSLSSTNTLQHQTSIGGAGKPPPPIPSYLDTRRAEHVQKLNEIQERFTLPRLRMVKSPWEAALETGSVDTAFQDFTPMGTRGPGGAPTTDDMDSFLGLSPLPTLTPAPAPAAAQAPAQTWTSTTTSSSTNRQSLNQRVSQQEKSFLYTPKAPRGWNIPQQQQTQAQGSAPTPAGVNYGYQAPPPQPQPQPQQPAAASKLSYGSLNNYNTAPRGWGQGLDYYRPVTFVGPTRVG